MPKIRKKSSKRMPLKIKHKIEHKVKEHRRKLRKLQGDQPKRLKKDPGIPNLFPFKAAMLEKIAEEKAKDEEQRLLQKEKRKKATEKKRRENDEKARKNAEEHPAKISSVAKRRWFFKEMNQVVEAADVIIEVLDARDPLGCRCPEIEQMVVSKMQAHGTAPKIIVLVINKIDLVPPPVVKQWITYLRREYPTIAFKASTQKGRGKIGQQSVHGDKADEDDLAKSTAVGASALLQLLKKYALHGKDMQKKKKKITVGVIGYPNVGKSSLINSLKRDRACGVSSTPGFTRALQEVHLDSDITLIDSPGVMFSADASEVDLVLRNCIKPDQLEDPLKAAQAVVERCPKDHLMQLYAIAEYKTADDFLTMVANKRGKLNRGGIPNLEMAARLVLQDWNDGKIPFYVSPPAQTSNLPPPTIVSQFSKEFDIDALLREADASTDSELKQQSADNDDAMDIEPEADLNAPSSSNSASSSRRNSVNMSSSRAFAILKANAPMKMDMSDLDQADSQGTAMVDDESLDTSNDDSGSNSNNSSGKSLFVFKPLGQRDDSKDARKPQTDFISKDEQHNKHMRKEHQKNRKQQGKMQRLFDKTGLSDGNAMEDADDTDMTNSRSTRKQTGSGFNPFDPFSGSVPASSSSSSSSSFAIQMQTPELSQGQGLGMQQQLASSSSSAAQVPAAARTQQQSSSTSTDAYDFATDWTDEL